MKSIHQKASVNKTEGDRMTQYMGSLSVTTAINLPPHASGYYCDEKGMIL